MAKSPRPTPLNQLLKQASRDMSRSIGASESPTNAQLAMSLVLRHLVSMQSSLWVVGGGYALRTYAPHVGRLPEDIDLYCLTQRKAADAAEVLQAVLSEPSDLPITFRIKRVRPNRRFDAMRGEIGIELEKPFSTIGFDVLGAGHHKADGALRLQIPTDLASVELATPSILVPSLASLVANKCLGIWNPNEGNRVGSTSTRGRDLIDLYIVARSHRLTATGLRDALRSAADKEGFDLPPAFIGPSQDSSRPLDERVAWLEAVDTGIDETLGSALIRGGAGANVTCIEMEELVAKFLSPVLRDHAAGQWRPELGEWSNEISQELDSLDTSYERLTSSKANNDLHQ